MEYLKTLDMLCTALANNDLIKYNEKEIEDNIVATAMLLCGYEWSTEEDRYIKKGMSIAWERKNMTRNTKGK